MNFAMWKKALQVIPAVSKQEWDALDLVSKWLISTRAAVLVMTFISAALAGLLPRGMASLTCSPGWR